MKVLRVQDHHGHVTQAHSSGKEEPIPKTIRGDGQENRWHLDLARSKRKEHRAAEDVPRSGPTETRDQVPVIIQDYFALFAVQGIPQKCDPIRI